MIMCMLSLRFFPSPLPAWAALGLVLLLSTAPLPSAEVARTVSGLTEPVMDVILSAPVAGIVAARHFDEGDQVKKGDVILELDKRLEELEVNRRKLVMDIRKMDLDKTKTLFEKTTSVPEEELEKKEADYKVAFVEHDMALEQLRRRLIIAPSDGVITDLVLDLGEAADAYQPLIRLVDPSLCRFECSLDASQASPLKIDQAVRLEIDSGEKPTVVTGKIAFLSPVADKASGLVRVKVLFENPDGRIRPGLAGKMYFPN